jgi:Co/Zn/Cd efflux system component
MHSASICTRNDGLGNLAVLLAAVGVFGTGTGWPDVVVAAIMVALALQGAGVVFRQAFAELHQSARLISVTGSVASGCADPRQSEWYRHRSHTRCP